MANKYSVVWTEQMIAQGIFDVMSALGITTMPGPAEVLKATGNQKLQQAIARRGGYDEWAAKMGLDRALTKTVNCADCEKPQEVHRNRNSVVRCEPCRVARKAAYKQKIHRATQDPISRTTDIIIVRAMEGRRKQTVKQVARDLNRGSREVRNRVNKLKKSGEWEKIWAYLQHRDKTYDFYYTSIC